MSDMTTSDYLREAYEVLRHPERWMQGAEHDGDRFCSIGAIKAVTPREHQSTVMRALWRMLPLTARRAPSMYDAIARYNDHRKYQSMMRIWERAIVQAEEAETAVERRREREAARTGIMQTIEIAEHDLSISGD
jgi:hypothetical protein